MDAILMAVAGFSMGYVVCMRFSEKKLKVLQENAYHAGFENGMDKAKNDASAELAALISAEQEKQYDASSKIEYFLEFEDNEDPYPLDLPSPDQDVFKDSDICDSLKKKQSKKKSKKTKKKSPKKAKKGK